MDTDCRNQRDREDSGKCCPNTHHCFPPCMPTHNVNGECGALVPCSLPPLEVLEPVWRQLGSVNHSFRAPRGHPTATLAAAKGRLIPPFLSPLTRPVRPCSAPP